MSSRGEKGLTIRMAELGRICGVPILILFTMGFQPVKVDHANLFNRTSAEFSESDLTGNLENVPEAIPLSGPLNSDEIEKLRAFGEISKANKSLINTETPINTGITFAAKELTKNSTKEAEKINHDPQQLQGNKYFTAKPTTMETIFSTTESHNFIIGEMRSENTHSNDDTTEKILKNPSIEVSTHSEDQFSNSIVNHATSVTLKMTQMKLEHTTTSWLFKRNTESSQKKIRFILRSNIKEDPCLDGSMRIQVDIQCKHCNKEVMGIQIIVPENSTVSGSCNEPRRLTIKWLDRFNNTFVLIFKIALILPHDESLGKMVESVAIVEVLLEFINNPKGFLGYKTSDSKFSVWAKDLNLFQTPINDTYSSHEVESVQLEGNFSEVGPITVTFTDVQFRAYATSHLVATDSALQSTPIFKTKELVICTIVGLFGIVLVIYIIIHRTERRHVIQEFEF